MRNHPAPRGLTLIEVIVAMAVTAVVLAAVVSVVSTQQRAYFDGQRQRGAQGAGRAALLFIEGSLALAGYGMDAPLALDFNRYTGPCRPEMNGCGRDATNNSDEIVFHHRNPRYWAPADYLAEPRGNAWRVTGAALANVTVNARLGDVFPRGQIVQVVCPGGALYAYATVSQTTLAAADGSLALPLEASDAANPFLRQDAMSDPCFSAGQARLFLIERHRFHVRPVPAQDGFLPYLVHDLGIDTNRDGRVDESDEIVVAEGIESLQFAYVLTSAALAPRGVTPGLPIAMAGGWPGVTGGEALTLLDFPGVVQPGMSAYRPTSFYGYGVGPPAHATRLTDHQGNIRAVAVAVVARSAEPDRAIAGGGILAPVLNQDRLPAWIDPLQRALPAVVDQDPRVGHYLRVRFDTTVPLRNMVVRAMSDF